MSEETVGDMSETGKVGKTGEVAGRQREGVVMDPRMS